MIRVLFVCLGNICRSPMAEAVFRHKVKEAGLEGRIAVDSAGTGNWHIGKGPHRGTCDILRRNNIDYSGIVARQVQAKDIEDFDYIIAMDSDNLSHLKRMAGKFQAGKLFRMLDFMPDRPMSDVPDPYYTGNFDEVFRLIHQSSDHLLSYIIEREHVCDHHEGA